MPTTDKGDPLVLRVVGGAAYYAIWGIVFVAACIIGLAGGFDDKEEKE